MQLHELKRKTKNKKARQVGRGGARGKTSGRGTKGQNARSGRKKRPELRDIIKKLPKKRGYKFNSVSVKPVIVKLALLESAFTVGDTVTPKILLERGIIKSPGRNIPQIKILGTGTLSKKLMISHCAVSASARTAIEGAGGSIEINSKPQIKKAK